MALVETISTNFDMKCPTDKLWIGISNLAQVLTKSSPNLFKASRVLEGDGRSAGSVIKVDMPEGGLGLTSLTVKFTTIDHQNKIMKYEIIGCESLMKSKHVRGTLALVPKATGGGCVARWDAVYEKESPVAILDGNPIAMTAKFGLLELDAYLLKT